MTCQKKKTGSASGQFVGLGLEVSWVARGVDISWPLSFFLDAPLSQLLAGPLEDNRL